ncbi:unnamed protein product [Psylliodes chrysocephalus]|uniref:Regulatory protein zeste n=1 Tax=Psylliodes chrysocephalus TaxID=3402493 RepID=A0A9P0CVF2_9CUCU|nr:unnamed protein product [Psylliodes chrysocephala]
MRKNMAHVVLIKKKRKRLKNTTAEQYELYLEAIENDYVLKSNTLNPTLEPNYLSKKWEELSNKLNAIGKGPALSAEEWKKRFADWRYATKAKYRRIFNYSIKTGGGPAIDAKLSPLEERSLRAWGMVTVEGNTMVTNYEGIPINKDTPVENQDEPEEAVYNIPEEGEEEEEENQSETLIITVENTPSTLRKRQRHKPLSVLAENLIEISGNNNNISEKLSNQIENFTEGYLNIEKKKKYELKKQKLNFEIKKF